MPAREPAMAQPPARSLAARPLAKCAAPPLERRLARPVAQSLARLFRKRKPPATVRLRLEVIRSRDGAGRRGWSSAPIRHITWSMSAVFRRERAYAILPRAASSSGPELLSSIQDTE